MIHRVLKKKKGTAESEETEAHVDTYIEFPYACPLASIAGEDDTSIQADRATWPASEQAEGRHLTQPIELNGRANDKAGPRAIKLHDWVNISLI
jgi:hypothetical protein